MIADHPGAQPITEIHLRLIEEAYKAYRKKHPTHRAERPPLKPGVEEKPFNHASDYIDDPRYDFRMCQMEWLLFWLRWALKKCKHPTFHNS